jgi:uncharacterized SAM-binding protein YcdF (DUF218 family)
MTIYTSSPKEVARPPAAKRRRSRRFPWGWLFLAGLLLAPFGWLIFREIQNQTLQPEAIFVLGGETKRERFAASFAARHPNLPVWVSGGAPKDYARRVFANKNVDLQRVHLDYQAIDTLSNFTSMVGELRQAGITSVYLVTADDHMTRSRLIGEIVFGGHGIAVKPVSFVSGRSDESWEKVLRDGGRAVFWLFTGSSGSNLVKEYKRLPEDKATKP